jgi:ATP-binding cassette subfamily C (CFTR/MRP) protein 1
MGFPAMALLVALSSMLFIVMIPQSAVNLHKRLLDTVENVPLSFFTAVEAGQTVNRFSQDLSVVDMELPLAGLILSNNFWLAIIQAILICISEPYFTMALPFVFIIRYILQKFYLRTSRQIRIMDLEAKSPLYSNFLETLAGRITFRSFGLSADMDKKK